MNKCPKCDATILNIKVGNVDVNGLKGIAHCCPFCGVIISVQIDPMALKADIVDEVTKKLRGY